MTLTLETVLALLTALGALVSIYVNLNEKITRAEERFQNLLKRVDDNEKWVKEVEDKMDTHQKEVTNSLFRMTNSIERLNQTLGQIEKKLNI